MKSSLVMVVVALAGGLWACGSDSRGSKSTGTTGPDTVATDAAGTETQATADGTAADGDDTAPTTASEATESEVAADVEVEAEVEVEPDTVAEVEVEPDTVAEVEVEPDTVAEVEPDSEPDTVAEVEVEPDTEPDTVAEFEVEPDTTDTTDPDTADTADTDVDPDTTDTDTDTDACTPTPAWSRKITRVGGVIDLSELMPLDPTLGPWVELANPMSVDVDVSNWQLSGAFAFTFPEGTFIHANARLLIAANPAALAALPLPAGTTLVGPLTGAWPATGARLELHNNTNRLMDLVAIDLAPWPVPAPGLPLTKPDPSALSTLAESWRLGPPGGTPGAPEPDGGPQTLIARDATWRLDLGGSEPPAWRDPQTDDHLWDTARAPILGGGAAGEASTFHTRVTADNHFAVYLGAADGTNVRLIGRDTSSDWTSPEDFALPAEPGDHLFLAGWEGPGDSGSPQMLIADVTPPEGAAFGTDTDTFEVVLGPPGVNPGDALADPAPNAAKVAAVIAAADATSAFAAPAAVAPRASGPWGGAIGGMFGAGSFVWFDTFDANSATNAQETYALFRSRAPLVADQAATAPTTAYFRGTFAFAGDPAATDLALTLTADDSAVVYLNGVEVARLNLPAGAITADTQALAPVSAANLVTQLILPTDHLVRGANLLAVEVHQAAEPTPDLRFAAELVATPRATSTTTVEDSANASTSGPIVINEIMYHGSAPAQSDWIELTNLGPDPVDLGGWQFVDAFAYTFPGGVTLAPGAFLLIVQDAAAFSAAYPDAAAMIAGEFSGGLANSGEQIILRDTCGAIQDRVRYGDTGRWPERADNGGSSLELRDPRADNSVPEAWAASLEGPRVGWQTISYRGVLAPSAVGPDGQWQEFVLGLLDDGEVLLDDLHVIADPDGQKTELIANPTFEGGAQGSMTSWRALGTQAETHVASDPDNPSNHVLHVIASGPTEHMHNQVVTTLRNNAQLQNGVTYAISFRARWVGGTDLLNTRLYFNRLAKTTHLARTPAGGTPGAPNSTEAAPSATLTSNLGPTFHDLRHTPVTPHALEPVTISVRADDPDGLSYAQVWSSVDGAAFTTTPMELGPDGRYHATLPGQPDGTLVQFFVKANDKDGASARFPARGTASRALYRVDSSDLHASAGALHTVRILMTPADNAAFHAVTNVMSNASTGVTVIYDERQVFYDIGTRAKGSERARDQQPRLGFSLRFDPESPLRGVLSTVSLDRSEGVISGEREILMDAVMCHAGSVSAEYNDLVYVVTPRPEHTGPAILQTTRFTDMMLDSQFESGADGNLYEYELVYFPYTTDDNTPTGLKVPEPDGVVGTNLGDLGPDPESYRYSYLLKTHHGSDDFSGIMALTQAFSLPEAEFRARIPEVLDIDAWLRGFAFMTVSGAVDHYGAGAQHNVQFYIRPSDGRGILFPHDLDFYPGDGSMPVVGSGDLQRLISIPGYKRIYYGHLYDIVTTTYNAAYMAHWRDVYGALLPGQPFASHYQFIVQRAQWLLTNASDAITKVFPALAFAITTHGGTAFQAPAGDIVLAGTGWIDVHAIAVSDASQAGQPVTTLGWTDDTHWQLTLPLAAGVHALTLTATDAHGKAVGSDTITVTATP